MNNEWFEFLQQRYSPIISKIINDNIRFYRMDKTIKWWFGFDERVAMFACCDRKTNVLTINIASVDFAFQQNEPLQIEYFLLHEIRHIFQHLEINDYKNNPEKCINLKLAKRWADEGDHYVSALDKNGNKNAQYFQQDLEFDAYAFAFAVMKYKYGEVPYLFKPKAYGHEFDEVVNEWIKCFEIEKL